MKFSRRHLLSGMTGLCAAVLTGCVASTVNGVTTITLDVAQADAWFQALRNSVTLIANLSGVGNTPAGLAVETVGSAIETDLTAFDKATNGQVVLAFTSTSVPAAVSSLEADATQLLTAAKTAVTGVAAADVATAQQYLLAVETIVSLFLATLGSLVAGAATSAAPRMSEAAALKTLAVTK